MKQIKLKGLALIMMSALTLSASAQSLGDLVKTATSAVSGSATSVLGSIIGTSTVSPSSITGTWNYSGPAVAFESENLLSQAGGKLASAAIEKKMGSKLAQCGITAGKMKLTFNEDKTFSCTVKGKTTTGTYAIDKATITFYTKTTQTKMLTANCKLSGKTLQLTFKADKMLKFMSSVGSVAGAGSTLGTIAGLAKNYKGMQTGIKMTK